MSAASRSAMRPCTRETVWGMPAAEAQRVITNLVEKYGQGGNAAYGTVRRYHNSFLIADPAEAWVLETSGHRWVARRVRRH